MSAGPLLFRPPLLRVTPWRTRRTAAIGTHDHRTARREGPEGGIRTGDCPVAVG